jgi:hypothetical protein
MSGEERDESRLRDFSKSVRNQVSELVSADNQPNAKSFDTRDTIGDQAFTVESEDYDRVEAPKDDLRNYWRQYETTPMVRKPVLSFASQVIEPGYYVKAPHLSVEERRELEQWLQSCAILEGELGKDWRNLAKKAVVQREVRGTVLVEKVPAKEDPDRLVGFKFLNPETIEVITHPDQSILLGPKATEDYEDVPQDESGNAAAYLQEIADTGQTRFGEPVEDLYDDKSKIAFTRDEIIKFTRDADVGEVYGTSRLEAVSTRIEGLKQKLQDNDEAIASKAYPLWMFLFGTEENPWSRDAINNFMQAQEMDNFNPGMKQGVRGDISVETISGEVADIAEYLQFDIDYIVSAMPMPKYALGGFAESVGQIAGVAQKQDVQRQIKEARRELETEFNPPLQEKAREMGMENPERVEIKIGSRDQPESEPEVNQNVIRYVGQGNEGDSSDDSTTDTNQDDSSDGISGMPKSMSSQSSVSYPEKIWDSSISNTVSSVELSTESGSTQGVVADVVREAVEKARDDILERIASQYVQSPENASRSFEQDANRVTSSTIRDSNLSTRVNEVLTEELNDVYEEYSDSPTYSYAVNTNASHYVSNVEMATRDAIDELMRNIRTQVRRGVESGDDFIHIKNRVKDTYSDAKISNRANLIAQMECTRARESTKLTRFMENDSIRGFRVVNEDASTPLCDSLHDNVVLFTDGDIATQLQDSVSEQDVHEGFEPVPEVPPYHYGCETTLEPVYNSGSE